MSEEKLRNANVLDGNGKTILDPSRQLKTIEQGAATSVWCAVSPQLNGVGGVYCENSDISPVITEDKNQGSNDVNRRIPSRAFGVFPYAIDPAAAERLWEVSEQLTGVQL